MPCYINGIGTVSPQGGLHRGEALQPIDHTGEKLTCIEPDYAKYFDVRQLRRMSRIIRLGMVAGMEALNEAGLKVPDGIITGTGYGCLDDTGTFLSKMIGNKEQALNPTPFIQSTHNTIGSQLALFLQCQGYNQTYTQRALSFENALIDALMSIAEDPTQRLLTGAADEITDVSHDILRRFRIFRRHSVSSLNLFTAPGQGTLNGEGAAYFLLSGTGGPGAVGLRGVRSFYKPETEELQTSIGRFLTAHECAPDDIDVVLAGKSGHAAFDHGMDEWIGAQLPAATYGAFKHLTGEFPGASAFAMALACRAVQQGQFPPAAILRDQNRVPRNVLIYNRYFSTYHSIILLSAT